MRLASEHVTKTRRFVGVISGFCYMDRWSKLPHMRCVANKSSESAHTIKCKIIVGWWRRTSAVMVRWQSGLIKWRFGRSGVMRIKRTNFYVARYQAERVSVCLRTTIAWNDEEDDDSERYYYTNVHTMLWRWWWWRWFKSAQAFPFRKAQATFVFICKRSIIIRLVAPDIIRIIVASQARGAKT